MPPETQIFDPNGDVILKFSHASQSTAPTQIEMRVSSKHMILASSVFAKMLNVRFREGSTLESTGRVEIPLPDDDPEAFTILAKIIHGTPRQVPQQVNLALLKKLSILVDKYQMQEVVAIFSEMWIRVLDLNPSKIVKSELLDWLCISWVFGDASTFHLVTETLVRTSDDVLDENLMSELPIPKIVIDRIQYERRQGTISRILQAVYNLLRNYPNTEFSCKAGGERKAACDAMVLGSLLQAAQRARLWPFPEPPYKGFTVDGLKKDLIAVEIRALCDFLDRKNGIFHHKGQTPFRRSLHYDDSSSDSEGRFRRPVFIERDRSTRVKRDGECELTASQAIKESIASIMNSVSNDLDGLSIEEFKVESI